MAALLKKLHVGSQSCHNVKIAVLKISKSVSAFFFIHLPTSLFGGIKSNLNLREEVFRFQSKSWKYHLNSLPRMFCPHMPRHPRVRRLSGAASFFSSSDQLVTVQAPHEAKVAINLLEMAPPWTQWLASVRHCVENQDRCKGVWKYIFFSFSKLFVQLLKPGSSPIWTTPNWFEWSLIW